MHVLRQWFTRYLSDPQALVIVALLGGGLLLLAEMGHVLAPVIASVIIAYLLHWIAMHLMRCGMPRVGAVIFVYIAFLSLCLIALLWLWPLLWQQLLHLFQELPNMVAGLQQFLHILPQKFPQFFSQEAVDGWVPTFLTQLRSGGRYLVKMTLSSLPSFITWFVYLFLVPLMVFFFLKDDRQIVAWCTRFLPDHRPVLHRVWREVDKQIGNYIVGKVAEAVIIGIFTYIVFYVFAMQYAVLLSVLVGLSVFIPYIGITVVTIPVVLVAFVQWGWGNQMMSLLIAYGVVQLVDGILLVPLLFSGVVSLHPLAIIIAILVFGSFWGFWGVFFAIPLAALVKALLDAWPTPSKAP